MAEQAIGKGKASYASDVCAGILEKAPECLDVRRVLRRAQLKMAGKSTGGSKMLQGVTNAPFMAKAAKQIKTDPMAVINSAEKMIKVNAHNIQAHKLLAEAAAAADMLETAAFGYDTIRKIDGKDIENLLALGETYLKLEKTDEAVKACDHILSFSPGHGGATELVRRASVAKSMSKGNWDNKDSSYKDNLKDEDEALSLEQASRNVNDTDTINKLIADVYAKYEAEPNNINNIRQLADLYRKLEDYDSALGWIRYARGLPTGQADTSLENLESEYYLEKMDKNIETKEAELALDPGNAAKAQELKTVRSKLIQHKMGIAKERVERYPNDFGYHFDYGQLLFEAGNYDASLQHLQKAQNNPNVRTKAMLFMGRAFNATGKYDMAVDQLKTLKGELQIMDDLKKSTIYDLASALESSGHQDEAMQEFKELYQNDIGYRDVSDKINAFYASK